MLSEGYTNFTFKSEKKCLQRYFHQLQRVVQAQQTAHMLQQAMLFLKITLKRPSSLLLAFQRDGKEGSSAIDRDLT